MTDPQDLPAGPELDRLMAETFLDKGDWYVSSPRSDSVIVHNGDPWMPSCDIGDAWYVVEKIRKVAVIAPFMEYGDRTRDDFPEQWACEIEQPAVGCVATTVVGYGDTAPLAICRAALKAVAGRLP